MRFTRFANRSVLTALALMSFYSCQDRSVTEPAAEADQVPARSVAPLLELSVGAPTVVAASDIAHCTKSGDEATALLIDNIAPTHVLPLGDAAYSAFTLTDYNNCYGPSWGRHKAITKPTVGDQDYKVAGAAGYFDYFGAEAGDRATGYYSYDVGEWHVVVLNSSLSTTATSAQVTWLKADLAASTKVCTMAYWHYPMFYSSSSGIRTSLKPVWDALYANGVEVVLNGNYKFYERFAPQTPAGTADDAYGIRQFVVGTGGAGSTSFATIRALSEARSTGTNGVLKLTLDANAYNWEFIPVAGKTFTDAGSGTCHPAPPPVAQPGGPYVSEDTVRFNGTASSDPQGDLPLTYEWDFGDGSPIGTEAQPIHVYSALGTYTVTLVVVDSHGNRSAPATTTAQIVNIPPVVRAGPDRRLRPDQSVTVSTFFKDQMTDAPWSYRIEWGDGTETTGSGLTDIIDPINATHAYPAVGQYTVTVRVFDKDGGEGVDALTATVSPPGTPEVIIVAGDISTCTNNRDESTAQVIDGIEGTVFTLGDNAYPNGRLEDYTKCYHPTWGRHRDRTFANLGNHEYDMGNANGSWDYFASGAGPRGKGYYSMDIGDWHIIVLNDNGSFVPYGPGSAQDTWLVNDLANNTKRCTMAIWHQPLFYSNTSSTVVRPGRKILWDRLYAAGVELVMHGHQHRYERFAPQTPDGVRNDSTGIREFIVGTGGDGNSMATFTAPNSEIHDDAYGVLKLTLNPDGYDWQFVAAGTDTFTDSGSGVCH